MPSSLSVAGWLCEQLSSASGVHALNNRSLWFGRYSFKHSPWSWQANSYKDMQVGLYSPLCVLATLNPQQEHHCIFQWALCYLMGKNSHTFKTITLNMAVSCHGQLTKLDLPSNLTRRARHSTSVLQSTDGTPANRESLARLSDNNIARYAYTRWGMGLHREFDIDIHTHAGSLARFCSRQAFDIETGRVIRRATLLHALPPSPFSPHWLQHQGAYSLLTLWPKCGSACSMADTAMFLCFIALHQPHQRRLCHTAVLPMTPE